MSGAGGDAQALALLNNPSALLQSESDDPLAQWLGPVVLAQLKTLSAPAVDAITTRTDGPLLWEHQPQGWLLGTRAGHPGSEAVDAALQQQGLAASSLEADRGPLTVWTKLQRKRSHGTDSLQAQLAVALAKDGNQAWWGGSLDALQQRRDEKALQPRLQQLTALADRETRLTQQLALAAPLSRAQLREWRPWAFVQTVAGRSLLEPVQGLALAVGPASSSDNATSREQPDGSDTLRLRVLLNLG